MRVVQANAAQHASVRYQNVLAEIRKAGAEISMGNAGEGSLTTEKKTPPGLTLAGLVEGLRINYADFLTRCRL